MIDITVDYVNKEIEIEMDKYPFEKLHQAIERIIDEAKYSGESIILHKATDTKYKFVVKEW